MTLYISMLTRKTIRPYYDCVFDKVRSGGYIIADNVLWSGKITENPSEMDIETKCLYDYSLKIKADERVENVLFPIRDGFNDC